MPSHLPSLLLGLPVLACSFLPGCITKGDTNIVDANFDALEEDRASCSDAEGSSILEPGDDTFLMCSDGEHTATLQAEDDVAVLRGTDFVAVLSVHTPKDVDELVGVPEIVADDGTTSFRIDDVILPEGDGTTGAWSLYDVRVEDTRTEAVLSATLDVRATDEVNEDLTLFNIFVEDVEELVVNGVSWKEKDPCPALEPSESLDIAAGSIHWEFEATKPVLSFCAWQTADRANLVEITPLVKRREVALITSKQSDEEEPGLRVTINASWLRDL